MIDSLDIGERNMNKEMRSDMIRFTVFATECVIGFTCHRCVRVCVCVCVCVCEREREREREREIYL